MRVTPRGGSWLGFAATTAAEFVERGAARDFAVSWFALE
jgi:hypothetical protein